MTRKQAKKPKRYDKMQRKIPPIVAELDEAFWHDDTVRDDYLPRIKKILRKLVREAIKSSSDAHSLTESSEERADRIARKLVP